MTMHERSLPSLPAAVPPALRFMLSDEARAEAEDLRRHVVDRIAWSNIPGERRAAWAEVHLVSRLPERWPLVARADAAVGGLLVDVLRAFASDRSIPGWWVAPLLALAGGRPDRLRASCEMVLGFAGSRAAPESYPEEAGDPAVRVAARHWQDRDLDEHEGDECPF